MSRHSWNPCGSSGGLPHAQSIGMASPVARTALVCSEEELMTSDTGRVSQKLGTGIRLRLSAMMFLQFFVWGAWFVTMGTFLGEGLSASGSQISLAYLTQSLGAILAPLIIGLIADQFFSAQKILGVLHIGGAILLWIAGEVSQFALFFPLILGYMILYMPTLALVNSVSFRQMRDPERQFPAVRVLGTIGWIVAGLIIGWLGWEQGQLPLTFKMAAVASLILGIYSFTLPATPPTRRGEKSSIAGDAGVGGPRLTEVALVSGVLPVLDSDLHSARLLLQLHQPVPQRGRR